MIFMAVIGIANFSVYLTTIGECLSLPSVSLGSPLTFKSL